MDIENIRKNAPKNAQGFYFINGKLHYCLVRRGRVYRLAAGFEIYESWLKYFRYEITYLD